MATVPTQVRIDRNVLPFSVELPRFSQSTLDAMAEAKRISHDPTVPSFDSMDELKKALDK